MKVIVDGNRAGQIAAGVEPFETAEVDVNLGDLTSEQRAVLARNPTLTVIESTAAAVIAALQDRVACDAEEKAIELLRQQERDARANQRCDEAAIVERMANDHGVTYPTYSGPEISDRWLTEPTSSRVREFNERLDREAAEKSAAALAAVQPQIDAAKAAAAQKNLEIQAAQKAEELAKFARRLETGIVEIPLSRGNRRDWGEPWIAKVTSQNGRRPEYDFSAGSYDLADETLTIACVPGEAIAYGQKNYRKPRKTIHEVRKMRPDGGLDPA